MYVQFANADNKNTSFHLIDIILHGLFIQSYNYYFRSIFIYQHYIFMHLMETHLHFHIKVIQN